MRYPKGTPDTPVEYIRDGMKYRDHGNWKERDFNGIRQTYYPANYGKKWMFYVSGFNSPGDAWNNTPDWIGHVLLFDGGTEPCRMRDDKILINGRWYDHSRWDH